MDGIFCQSINKKPQKQQNTVQGATPGNFNGPHSEYVFMVGIYRPLKSKGLYNSDNLMMWLQIQFQRIYFGSSEGGGNKIRYFSLVYGLKTLFVNVHGTLAKTTEAGMGRPGPE